MKVLEIVGCHSSVASTLVTKAKVPGFDSPATTKIFHILPLLLLSGPVFIIFVWSIPYAC